MTNEPQLSVSSLESTYSRWNASRSHASDRGTWHRIEDTTTGSCALLGGCSVEVNSSVTHVLSLINRGRGQEPVESVHGGQTCVIEIADQFDADIVSVLPACFEFLDAAAESGGLCYVHCECGRSRSALSLIHI